MNKFIYGIIGSLALTGCVIAPYAYYGYAEPEVVVGYYDPQYGYWTGYGWDQHYYENGHSGYGHPVYRGPRYVKRRK